MKTSTLLSLIGGALASLAIASGCSSDNSKTTPLTESGLGESCARTSDCQSGLLCLGNVCTKSGSTSNKDGGVQMSGTGGSGTTTPPVLGDQGESCTRRADCKTGLACIRQTCTSSTGIQTGGDGGLGAPVGVRGESCLNAADCGSGLVCVPRPDQAAGICDLANYGLSATGKTCSGQCSTATDCCQLPPDVDISGKLAAPPEETVSSCTDVVQLLLGGDAATKCAGTPTGDTAIACFYYQTYCNCAASTWSCTANQCVYSATCTTDGDTFGGCPSQTRTGEATITATCNGTSHKCDVPASGCKVDLDCKGLAIVDDPQDSCSEGECACVTGECLRKCTKNSDCAQHYTCDSKTSVCVSAGNCSSDNDCVTQNYSASYKCQAGECVIPCASDQDCGPSGYPGFGTPLLATLPICGPQHTCIALGCASNDDCNYKGDTNVREFCVTPTTNSGPGYQSAVPVHTSVF